MPAIAVASEPLKQVSEIEILCIGTRPDGSRYFYIDVPHKDAGKFIEKFRKNLNKLKTKQLEEVIRIEWNSNSK